MGLEIEEENRREAIDSVLVRSVNKIGDDGLLAGTLLAKNSSRQLSILVFSMFLLRQITKDSIRSSTRPSLNRMLSRSAIVAAISTAGWMLGLVPSLDVSLETRPLQKKVAINFGTLAIAQSIDNARVPSFVQSTLEIELAREATLQNIRNISPDGRIPIFECDLAAGTIANIESFSGQVRQSIQNFCNQSQAIVQQNQLSATDFRNIKNQYERNPQQYPQITRAFQRSCQQRKYQRLQICR